MGITKPAVVILALFPGHPRLASRWNAWLAAGMHCRPGLLPGERWATASGFFRVRLPFACYISDQDKMSAHGKAPAVSATLLEESCEPEAGDARMLVCDFTGEHSSAV